MAYDVRLEQRPGVPLAVVKRTASATQLSQVVPAACGAVWNVIRAEQVPGAGRHVAIYYDGEINLEVGVEVPSPFAGHGEVIGSTTPAGLVAWTSHLGPYGLLSQAHQAIVQWCQQQGHQLAGPNWEIYGHWQDAWNRDPSQIQTEVCYLVVPRVSPDSIHHAPS